MSYIPVDSPKLMRLNPFTSSHRFKTFISLTTLTLTLTACGGSNSNDSSSFKNSAQASNSATVPVAPLNSAIQLPYASAVEPLSDSLVYDESALFAPSFGVNQNDPSLADLFGKNGQSSLCVPTSIAEALIYLYGKANSPFNHLLLNGLSSDHSSIDPNALVRQMALACKTDLNNGTSALNDFHCISSMITNSGYGMGNTQFIDPFDTDSSLPLQTRIVTISDIREALKAGDPVLLEVSWYQFNAVTGRWTRTGGHHIGVYGYDYNNSWGEDQIQVKVINPEHTYALSTHTEADGTVHPWAVFDTVTISKYSPQPGVTYPANSPYILSGSGFGGSLSRGFLGSMTRISPAQF